MDNNKKYLWDSCSLLSFVRYYLSLDHDKIGFEWLKENFGEGNFIYLSAIHNELKYLAGGLVLKRLDFLNNTKAVRAKELIDLKQHNKIDNNWVVGREKARLKEKEYIVEKYKMLKGADFQLLLFALDNPDSTIITEESSQTNDNKLFKKIPLICKTEEIHCIALSNIWLLPNC